MKEAIGATQIFVICLTFIILLTGYLAVSVNYAKAFKIKNYVVGLIEEKKELSSEVIDDIETYLTAQGYGTYGECQNPLKMEGTDTEWKLESNGCLGNAPRGTNNCGICIYSLPVETANDDFNNGRKYYRVVTFWKFDLPIVNIVLKPFKVSGESKYILTEGSNY